MKSISVVWIWCHSSGGRRRECYRAYKRRRIREDQRKSDQTRMHTIIANDMGKAVALGTRGAGVNTIYCGLHVGRGALPETDGYCGPFDGPACFSCQRKVGGVSEEHMELLKLRAVKAQCKQSLENADRQRRSQETALRRELDAQKRLVRGLEADKQAGEVRIAAGQKRIRELEAGAGDEWTRECEKVWPVLHKAVALRFHPDKSAGHADQAKFEAFFKVANNKNAAFNKTVTSVQPTATPEIFQGTAAKLDLGVDEDEVY